jgi:hypothetical protein
VGSHVCVGLPYFRHCFGGSREDVDTCGRLPALLQSLRAFISVLLRLSTAAFLPLPNELLSRFFISRQTKQTPQSPPQPQQLPLIVIIIIITPLYSYSRVSTRCCLSQCFEVVIYCFRLWQQYFLYASSHHTHTFFRNFTRTHIAPPYPLSGLPQRPNKQKGIRSLTAAPRPTAMDTDHV